MVVGKQFWPEGNWLVMQIIVHQHAITAATGQHAFRRNMVARNCCLIFWLMVAGIRLANEVCIGTQGERRGLHMWL